MFGTDRAACTFFGGPGRIGNQRERGRGRGSECVGANRQRDRGVDRSSEKVSAGLRVLWLSAVKNHVLYLGGCYGRRRLGYSSLRAEASWRFQSAEQSQVYPPTCGADTVHVLLVTLMHQSVYICLFGCRPGNAGLSSRVRMFFLLSEFVFQLGRRIDPTINHLAIGNAT